MAQALTNPITNPTPATKTQIKKLPTLSSSLNFNNLFSSSRILSLLRNPSSSLEYLSNSLCLSMNDCFLFMIYFMFYSQVKYSQFRRQSRFQGFFRKRTQGDQRQDKERGYLTEIYWRRKRGQCWEAQVCIRCGDVISSQSISSLQLQKLALSIIRQSNVTLASVSSRFSPLIQIKKSLSLRYFSNQSGKCPKKTSFLLFFIILNTKAMSLAQGILILSSQKFATPFLTCGCSFIFRQLSPQWTQHVILEGCLVCLTQICFRVMSTRYYLLVSFIGMDCKKRQGFLR